MVLECYLSLKKEATFSSEMSVISIILAPWNTQKHVIEGMDWREASSLRKLFDVKKNNPLVQKILYCGVG
jgi:hypothetical protein